MSTSENPKKGSTKGVISETPGNTTTATTKEPVKTSVKKRRIIKVYRNTLMIHESNPALKDYFAQHTRAAGAYWDPVKRKSGHPFNPEELAILMPPIIDIADNERGYVKAIDDYFSEMEVKIPDETQGGPLTLDLSLQDNSKPLSIENMPLNIEEYIKGRWLMSHPDGGVGEDVKGQIMKVFYIIDPEQEDLRKATIHQDQDQALEQYLVIRRSAERVAEMLILLGKDPDEIPRKHHTSTLRQLAEDRPKDFIKFSQDPNVAAKILIRNLVKFKIVKREGNRYLDSETNKQIGATEMDAIMYLLDAENSKVLNIYKAKLENALEAEIIKE